MILRYKPMLAKNALKPFNDKDWLFEIKWDGFRTIAYINEEISLKSRNGKELKDTFPELLELGTLTSKTVLDGEIVVVKNEKANFQAISERAKVTMPTEAKLRSARTPAIFIVFDILEKDGKPLLDLPLIERKKILINSVKEEGTYCFQTSSKRKEKHIMKQPLRKG